MTTHTTPQPAQAQPVFFAMNRHRKTACIMERSGFPTFDHVSMALHVGIMMPDGQSASGIGRCASMTEFTRRAAHSGFTILS